MISHDIIMVYGNIWEYHGIIKPGWQIPEANGGFVRWENHRTKWKVSLAMFEYRRVCPGVNIKQHVENQWFPSTNDGFSTSMSVEKGG
jgi:hypothetical protein